MILIWNKKVFHLDEDLIYRWSGTSERLRAFRESLHTRMTKREADLGEHHLNEEAVAMHVVSDVVIQVYMRLVVAVLEDLQELMGKRDFNKCFRLPEETPRSARMLVHDDTQIGLDLDQRREILCGVCKP